MQCRGATKWRAGCPGSDGVVAVGKRWSTWGWDNAFTLSVAVSNGGEGAAAATMLRYFRSADATITSSDTKVGTDAIGELAASENSSQSLKLTAPSSPGTYYYGACVDPVTDESDTTNNCSTSVQVTVPETETETEPQPGPEPEPEPERHPDLVVSPPSVSDSGPAGGAQFTLSATVRNHGEGAAAATMLRYHQSTDATITTSDTALATVAIAGLAAAGSSSQSVDPTAPSRPGTYYYGACVAPVPDETDTTNNCSASVPVTVPEPKRPDLVVTLPRVNDGGPAAGAEFTLSATVRNDGEGTAAGTTLSYYLSTDATITAADTSLETVAIAGLAGSGSSSQSVELTAPSRPGTYYYGACVDPVAGESDTTNNCSLSVQVTVQVTVTPPRGNPDLIVTSVEVSDSGLEAGATFTLSAVVENAGEGKSEATALRYYQSTDATITATDTWVGTVTIAGLAGSGSSSQSVELTAPSSPGRYYYGACVDAVPGESDTTNNCSGARTVRVVEGPDLVVGGPFVSNGTPEAGGTFLLVVSVRNRGDATSAATTVRHYRSTDATVTSADTLEGTEEVRPLGSLQSSGKEIYLTAPLTPGTYYYGSCVDPVPGESDTTNNCSESREVTAREPEPVNTPPTGLPTISGTPQVGETLTASVAGIEDADGLAGVTFAYQWISRDGTTDTEIAGATNDSYTLTVAEAGKTIKVRVSFTTAAATTRALRASRRRRWRTTARPGTRPSPWGTRCSIPGCGMPPICPWRIRSAGLASGQSGGSSSSLQVWPPGRK